MPVTSADIVNQALQMVGDNMPAVQGNSPTFDDSTAGQAAQRLYAPAVATVGRLFEWDMARRTVVLTLSGGAPFPWDFQYLYPTNGLEVWQVMPGGLSDPNNPLPTTWVVANAVVSSAERKVIHTNVADAVAVYNNNPGPDVWDAGFREAVVRLLASEFAMAVAGRPETSQNLLQSFNAFVTAAKSRDG
jgi:hypothetical protein